MKVKIVEDYAEMSRDAAEVVAAMVRQKPNAILGLATGSTPLGMYQKLVQLHREEGLDFSRVITFNLDEYYGLAPDHPASYHYYMWENLFRHINIRPENIHIPDGTAADVEKECKNYEARIRKAGYIDLQVLGIGANGHIGFNEPGTDFGSETHLIELTETTIQANARFFASEKDVPRQALSMGIKSIMRSRHILLLASGEAKAEAVAAAVEGPVTQMVPASILQLHPDVTFIVDQAAAQYLTGSFDVLLQNEKNAEYDKANR